MTLGLNGDDLSLCCPSSNQHVLEFIEARRVNDTKVLGLLRLLLKASGKQGVPQGGVISPRLSNVYLNQVDKLLERAKTVTRYQRWTAVEYARFADDLVILLDSHPRQLWLRGAVEKRLREELTKLQVEVNEEKSRKVDLQEAGSFGFLGFEFRRIRSRRGPMDAAACAARQKADGLAPQAQADFPKLSLPARERVDRTDQSHSAGVGELLRDGPFEPVLRVHPRLGRKEDSAPSGPRRSAPGLRVEAVEQGMAVWDLGTLL